MIEPVEGLEILEAGLDGVRRRGEDISSSCCLMRADVGDVGGVIGSGEEGAATASPGVEQEWTNVASKVLQDSTPNGPGDKDTGVYNEEMLAALADMAQESKPRIPRTISNMIFLP